ncbi:Clr5 domain [Fusarium oxysporum f. sp. vasinfectum]|uniref:Clr5 domain-containing protein n=1 Tax=Fusarium oxysporum f. sp. vasinfectum 25433 TaxID=1089449 RepID=X0KUK4_FUSOX|nr:hypothetical protein FOTG_19021 [Fusarium oxysporum f. sp. vasinfectum 25433]KAK2926498.1 Clr5 domain [Fusarium oxysporum f. sp. vasinfectum]
MDWENTSEHDLEIAVYLSLPQPEHPDYAAPGHLINYNDNMIIDNPQINFYNFSYNRSVELNPISPFQYQQPVHVGMDSTMLGFNHVDYAQSDTHHLSFHTAGLSFHQDFAQMALSLVDSSYFAQAMPSEAVQQRRRFDRTSDSDWEARKKEIRQIYIKDNLSLKETMKRLEGSWIQSPTAIMYKKRFKSWGAEFQKNMTRSNAIFIPNEDERQPRRRQAQEQRNISIAGPPTRQMIVPTASLPNLEMPLEAFVNNIRTFLGRVFAKSANSWRVDKFNFQSTSASPRWTKSWELLFHQSQEASILARGERKGNLKFMLEDILFSIRARFITEANPLERNDPYALVYFFRILMEFHDIRRRGSQRMEINRQDLLRVILDTTSSFADELPREHPLAGFLDLVKTPLQESQLEPTRFRFIEFLSWSHSQILRAFKAQMNDAKHPVILNMTAYHLSTWRTYVPTGISLRAEYEILQCNSEFLDPSSEEAIKLLLDYATMVSNNSQGLDLQLVGIMEELHGHSLNWILRQTQLQFQPTTYAFIFSTEWLSNKAYEFPKYLYSSSYEYLDEAIEILRHGDSDCCIWAASFSKRMKLWFKNSNQKEKFQFEIKRLHHLTVGLETSVVLASPRMRNPGESRRKHRTARRKMEEQKVFELCRL